MYLSLVLQLLRPLPDSETSKLSLQSSHYAANHNKQLGNNATFGKGNRKRHVSRHDNTVGNYTIEVLGKVIALVFVILVVVGGTGKSDLLCIAFDSDHVLIESTEYVIVGNCPGRLVGGGENGVDV